MITIDKKTKAQLLEAYKNNGIALEGNILKLIDSSDDEEFNEYIKHCISEDKNTRRKRLEVTKKVQSQNEELNKLNNENQRIMKELQNSLEDAENAKQIALNDLDVLQKKSQTELIGKIVMVSLGVVIMVGIMTTFMYIFAIFMGRETQIIGSTWSNMLGILLTNAFSILGTIMGIKYASKEKDSK
jgi:hypothetical protein